MVAAVSSDGQPVMRMSLRRERAPAAMVTEACGKRRWRAKNEMQARLASPSTGAAWISRRSSPAESEVRRSRAERGFTLSQKETLPGSILSKLAVVLEGGFPMLNCPFSGASRLAGC